MSGLDVVPSRTGYLLVSNVLSTRASRGPRFGLRPVCCASIWYVGLPRTRGGTGVGNGRTGVGDCRAGVGVASACFASQSEAGTGGAVETGEAPDVPQALSRGRATTAANLTRARRRLKRTAALLSIAPYESGRQRFSGTANRRSTRFTSPGSSALTAASASTAGEAESCEAAHILSVNQPTSAWSGVSRGRPVPPLTPARR